MTGRFAADERGASIAVTHVLAIGITTLLISTLIIGASGILEEQQDKAARTQLETIGHRVSNQIARAATAVTDGNQSSVRMELDQPARVSGGTYTIQLEPGSECTGIDSPPSTTPDRCVVLEPTGLNIRTVRVPVNFDDDVTVSLSFVGSGEVVITATRTDSGFP